MSGVDRVLVAGVVMAAVVGAFLLGLPQGLFAVLLTWLSR